MNTSQNFWQRIFLLTILATACCGITSLAGQEITKQEQEGKETPPVEVVEIKTKDGVNLKCDWYAGIHDKETIPVLMLHDWGGSRADLTEHAEKMQKENGFAILVPDLRGHGESLHVDGIADELDREKWKPAEIASIIADIEACKKFLTEKNNEGELNVDLLTLVAEGKICIHALQWAISDWQFETFGGVKQGKDVKALVLLAPEKAFRGLNLTQTMKHPLFTGDAERSLSLLIMGDKDKSDKSLRESKSIFTSMERMRKPKKYLYYLEYATKAQVKVVENEKADSPLPIVMAFFVENEAKRFKDDFRWQDRKRD